MSLMKRIKLSSAEIKFLQLMCVWPCSQRPFKDSKHTNECFLPLVSYINTAWYSLCQNRNIYMLLRSSKKHIQSKQRLERCAGAGRCVFRVLGFISAGSNYSEACTLGGEVAREPDLLTSEPRGSLLLTKITCWQFQFINSSNLSRRKEEEEEEKEGKEKE